MIGKVRGVNPLIQDYVEFHNMLGYLQGEVNQMHSQAKRFQSIIDRGRQLKDALDADGRQEILNELDTILKEMGR